MSMFNVNIYIKNKTFKTFILLNKFLYIYSVYIYIYIYIYIYDIYIYIYR